MGVKTWSVSNYLGCQATGLWEKGGKANTQTYDLAVELGRKGTFHQKTKLREEPGFGDLRVRMGEA